MRTSSLLLASLALAPSLLAQRFPEVEPNNTNATAQAVLVSTQIDASLVAGEQDWYSFTLSSATRIRIHTSGLDTRIALLDATGTTYLGIDDDSRTTVNEFASEITLNIAAGSYMVQVVGFSATTAGPYSLDIGELTPVSYMPEVEPNDTHLTATPTNISLGPARFEGNLAAPVPQFTSSVSPHVTVASYTATAGTTTTLTVSGLTASQYVGGYAVSITSGPNLGLIRQITSNTATTITTSAFPVANPAGTTFDVIEASTTTVTRSTLPLVPALWTPTTAGFGRFSLRFTSGANAGLARQITSNTASTITTGAFPAGGSPTDTFVVELVDVDYYQVVLTAPFTSLWFQINEGSPPWVYGHRYELYDALGAPLTPTATLGANNGTASTLTPRTSQIRVLPPGVYFIAVRQPATPFAPSSTMPNGIVPTGNYTLEVFTMPMDTGATVPEAAEPNSSAATATPINPGDIGQGSVTNATDANDWWGPITITTPSSITIQTRQGAATALTDSTINLRDASGALLASATSGNTLSPTSHARLVATFNLAPQTFYIEVASPGTTAAQSGNYELQISSIIPAPYVTASFTEIAANTACGTAPFPTLTRQFDSEVPALGSTFARQLINCPPNVFYIHFIGFSNTASGSTPLPFDLAPLGAPGCTINVDPEILTVGTTDAAGTADIITVLPPTTAFRGFVWYEQAFVERPGVNAFNTQVTNYGRAIVGERTY